MIFCALLIIVAAIANAAMDKVQFHFGNSVFRGMPKLDPATSWRNKWKNGNNSEGEAFAGSSTIFVCLTDFWHLMKTIQISTLIMAMSLAPRMFDESVKNFIALFVLGKILYSSIFHVFFTYVFNKR